MKSVWAGGWLFICLYILALFGGCTAFAGGVTTEWIPPFAIWIGLTFMFKVLNDRFKKVKWPMEFVMWSVLLLVAINLVWLGFMGT